jgi:YVTN family beta-propeller protein
MRRRLLLVVFTAAVSGSVSFAEPVVGLRKVGVIPLPGVEGRFDHFAFDAKGERLYVAALENQTLEVIDTRNNARAGTVKKLGNPAGVAFAADTGRLAVGCGADEACVILNAATLEPVGKFSSLPDADNVRYDPADGLFYCGYGEGTIAVLDPRTQLVNQISVAGHPESFQLESKGPRMFVNVPDGRGGPQVAVIDRKQRKRVAVWTLTGAGSNFPMALDEANHRLFIGCRKPAKLLVLDTETGKTVAAVDCVGDTDDLFYDARVKRIYVSGGAGALTIIRQQDADHYQAAGTIDTAPGARTSFFAPSAGLLYLAVPHRGGQPAAIWIFERDGAP